MNRILIIVFICFLIAFCNNSLFTKSDLFPRQAKSDSLLVVSLDTIKDIKRLNELICAYSNPTKSNLIPHAFLRFDDIDIPIYKSRWLSCWESGIINCYRERTFITIEKDSFVSVKGKMKFDVENLENHLTKRFLNPESMYLSDPRFTVIIIEIPSNKTIDSKRINKELSIITDSYFSFFKKNISKDSVEFYKERYPFNLMFERPFYEVLKSPPPPKPESILIED